MAFADAAVGGLVGAVVGGVATYVGEHRLQKQRSDDERKVRLDQLRQEIDLSRVALSRAAAVDVLQTLWAVSEVGAELRWARRPSFNDDRGGRALDALAGLKHAVAVLGPQLTNLALRQQLEECQILASEYVFGEWDAVNAATTAEREIKLNRGGADFEAFVAWTSRSFTAYVDGSWSVFGAEPRPVLSRDDTDSWVAPDQRET